MELELNDIEIKQKTFTLIGMGPGNPQKLTAEAIIALRKAELIAGATRIMEQAKSILPDWTEKKTLMSARNEEILHFIREHDECTNIAILFSGDLGRYSGATEMRSLLDREYLDAEIRVLPGIGSAVEFLDRLGIPQEKVLIESAHGRPLNLIPLINSHRYVLAFLGSGETVRDTAEELMEYGMNLVRITTGTRLSYPDEEIHMGSPKEFTEAVVNALSLVLFENPEADEKTQSLGIPDDKFERGNVPMTKQEIRILSLSRLNVQKDSVVWDIGAGTGSIAIEASRQAEQGVVYAVERKEEAIELLKKNRRKFRAANVNIVEDEAPYCLKDLPEPDKVVIGGSGGKLTEIVKKVFEKNPYADLVIHAVTLETLSELERLAAEYEKDYDFEFTEIAATRYQKLGNYHMRRPETPVTIVSVKAKEGELKFR